MRAQGAGFDYEVIGWVGWHLTGYSIGGKGKLFGSFTRVIWDGIQCESSTRRRLRRSIDLARRLKKFLLLTETTSIKKWSMRK